jgi:hypothetical protein
MEALKEFNELVIRINEVAGKITGEVFDEISDKAPIIVHQRFCHELVRICSREENKLKTPAQVPEAMNVMTAIDILEKVYPKLKDK